MEAAHRYTYRQTAGGEAPEHGFSANSWKPDTSRPSTNTDMCQRIYTEGNLQSHQWKTAPSNSSTLLRASRKTRRLRLNRVSLATTAERIYFPAAIPHFS